MTDRVRADTEERARNDSRERAGNQNTRVSPWPPLVAGGFAVAEIGIALNLVALAIGGIVLFGGSVGGILHETAYVESAWATAAVVGTLFLVLGTVVWTSQVSTLAVGPMLEPAATDTVATRGEAIVVGGGLLVLGAIAGAMVKSGSAGEHP